MSPWLGHVGRKFFFDIAIEFFPISIVVKVLFVNIRCFWIKGKASHVKMFLKISKDVIGCLKMAEMRISLVL
jgi:hypothetical protein